MRKALRWTLRAAAALTVAVLVFLFCNFHFWIRPDGAVQWRLSVPAVFAQAFDLQCPNGSQGLPDFTTRNPSTGRLKQFACVDSNGTISLNGISTSVLGTFNGIVYLDGSVNTTLAATITLAGSLGTIEVAPSAGTITVPASVTVPAGVTLRVDQGAILSIAAGQKLTVAGPFQAGNYQAFSAATGTPAAITAASQSTGGAIAITAASETGNTVTITTTLNPGVGNQVLVSGVTPAGYNQVCWVLTSSGTNFTCYDPTSGLGAGTVFGTAAVITNTVTITSTLNPGVGNLVQISGVTPAAYNGVFWVLTSSGTNFTVYNSQIGIAAGSAFGTAASPGTVVFTLPGNEGTSRPEWWGGVADGSSSTPVTGTDNQAAFTFALNSLPIFTLPSQGSYTENNGMVARTGKLQLSLGRYVVGQALHWSERVKYNCPAYAGCTITLKNGIATTNEMYAVQMMTNPSGANSTFGAQLENISIDCNGGNVYGTNTQASGLFIVGAQGTALGTLEVFNCGRRGLWLGPQAVGNVNAGTSINGPCDIWVTQITQGPAIQMDASVTFCSSVRFENSNTSGTFLDADGDPRPGLLLGSELSNGSVNIHIGMGTGEFDGLPVKVWGGSAVDLDSVILLPNAGGQATALVISHQAGGVWVGRFFNSGSAPNLFTNYIVDRTTSPTTNVSGNFSNFPLSRGYYSLGGFGNVGPFRIQNPTVDSYQTFTGVTFANLGTPANGNVIFCSDCTIANPCAAAGTGALAKRLNGVWVCN